MERKELMQDLHHKGDIFRQLCKVKNYKDAKGYYEDAREMAVANQLTEDEIAEIFGIREERGVILRVGAFPEEDVMDMYEWTAVRKPRTKTE